MNRPPAGGALACSPALGTALLTNFTITASGWTDPEADLPLAYRFLASVQYGASPVLLQPDDTRPVRQVSG